MHPSSFSFLARTGIITIPFGSLDLTHHIDVEIQQLDQGGVGLEGDLWRQGHQLQVLSGVLGEAIEGGLGDGPGDGGFWDGGNR